MYVNKATVAISPQECYIKFSCLGPVFDENENVVGSADIESCQIVMNREMMFKLRDMITEVFENENAKKESGDE